MTDTGLMFTVYYGSMGEHQVHKWCFTYTYFRTNGIDMNKPNFIDECKEAVEKYTKAYHYKDHKDRPIRVEWNHPVVTIINM